MSSGFPVTSRTLVHSARIPPGSLVSNDGPELASPQAREIPFESKSKTLAPEAWAGCNPKVTSKKNAIDRSLRRLAALPQNCQHLYSR